MKSCTEIHDILQELLCEFEATGAWMGHAYGFENMYDLYTKLCIVMDERKISSTCLKDAYTAVSNEFERIIRSNIGFMDDTNTKELERLDGEFLDTLAHSAQMVSDRMGFSDELCFEPITY